MQSNAPQFWLRFFRWFCKPEYAEDIEGDLLERFDKRSQNGRRAGMLFMWDVIQLFRPSMIKTFEGTQKLNFYGMFKHNLLIALRGFKRHRSSFLINLVGLASGFAMAILIYLWVHDEMSVDKFNEKDDRLYRTMTHFQLSDRKATWEYTSGRLGSSLKQDFPQILRATRVNNRTHTPKGVFSFGEKNIEIQGLFAGENLFSVMSYKVIKGDPQSAISNKESVVISESLAEKLFGDSEALGRMVEWESQFFNKSFEVTGVFESPPKNATRQFEAIISYDVLIEADEWAGHWKGGYAENYLELADGVDVEEFNKKIENYYDSYMGHERFTLFLQKYSDWYLFGQYEDGQLVGGRIGNVKLFLYVAIFILVIASINFINLTTAQASIKLKEIGVKKTLGGSRLNLIFQFLQESLLLAFLSIGVATLLVYSALPFFNELVGKSLEFSVLDHLGSLLISPFLLGLLAGAYPAFYLSSFEPSKVIKGKLPTRSGEHWIRKGLVITQFALSVVFIVGVLVINRQLDFMNGKPLGYNKNNVLVFEGKGSGQVEEITMVSEISKIPGVVNATNMAGDFLWGRDSGSGYTWNEDKNNANYLFKSPKIGYNTIETLELEILEGRSFDPAFNDDRTKVILNESAVKMMGLKNPVGFKLGYGDQRSREVIGVVKDFQYGSMHQKIEPVLFRFRDWGRNYIVRIQPGKELEVIERIEKIYADFYPKYAFDGNFLADDYKALYSTEERIGNLSGYFAAFAILISCLGLFGLARFSIERRVKEIGIRKVLGCQAWKIVYLLTTDFTRMVILAILFALPFSYIAGKKWLENFAYQIEIEWWFFAIAGFVSLLIAWITVGTQTIRAALANPVDSLKDE